MYFKKYLAEQLLKEFTDDVVDRVASVLADNVEASDDEDVHAAIEYEVQEFADQLRDRLGHLLLDRR